MFCRTSSINSNPGLSDSGRKVKILGWTAGSMVLVSMVALTTLFLLSHFNVIPPFSPLVLYIPPGAAGSAALLLAFISLCIHCCQSTSKKPTKQPSPPEEPRRGSELPKPVNIRPPSERPLTAQEKVTQNIIDQILTKKTAPPAIKAPPLVLEPLDFFPPPSPQEVAAWFIMAAGDFMGMKAGGVVSLQILILIRELETLKKKSVIKEQSIDRLIRDFHTSFTIAVSQEKLNGASSLQAYRQGREAVSSFILSTLEKEGRVLIPSGYALKGEGHAIYIEFILEDKAIRGRVLNSGEGLQYHASENGESDQHFSLTLAPVSFEIFKTTSFLDLLTDFRIFQLSPDAAEYQVEKETLFSIKDIYEVLLPLWPGAMMHNKDESHHEQYSNSCTVRPLLLFVHERLEEEGAGAEEAKIALGLQAFQLLMDCIERMDFDPARVQDALAKLNRSAVSLDRRGKLPQVLKNELLELSANVNETIHKMQKEKVERLLTQEIAIKEWSDLKALAFSIAPATSMEATDDLGGSAFALIAFDKRRFAASLREASVRVNRAIRTEQLHAAKSVARHVLLSIPNPSDPFWLSKRSDQEMQILTDFVMILLKEQTRTLKPILTTPNEALLYLKVLTISFVQAPLGGVPKELVAYYGVQTKWALSQTASLYRPTHPAYAAIFSDCQRMIQAFHGEGKEIRLSSFNNVGDLWGFDFHQFTSLSKMLENQEMQFLYQFLQSHPELLKTSYQGILNEKWDLIRNTSGLFEDFAFFLGDASRNITFREKRPASWEPVRQLTLLRSLHYYFLMASYVTGSTFETLGDVVFAIRCNGYLQSTRVEAQSYKPEDRNDLTKGLFLDTFYPLSKEAKTWVSSLLKESSSLSQNHHLLTQQGVTTGKEFSLSALEVQQLLSIKAHDELMIPQLVGFFTRHFAYIQAPTFQALFSQFLFSLNKEQSRPVLQEVFSSSSFVKAQLFSFLKIALSHSQKLQWHETYHFFLYTFVQCARYFADVGAHTPLFSQIKSVLQEHMEQLLKDEKSPSEVREKAYYTLVSCVPYLDHPSLVDLLPLCREAGIKKQQVKAGVHGLQREEDHVIGKMQLQLNVQPKDMLPDWIVNHNDYLFDQNFCVGTIQEGLYEFDGAEGNLYRIATQKNALRTYQKIAGNWYEHKGTSPFAEMTGQEHPCSKGYLTRNVRAWYSVESPQEVLIIPIENAPPLCRVKSDGIFHPSLPSLRLAADYTDPLLTHFSRLASKCEILVWKNVKDIVERIEIPDLALTFQWTQEQWRSPQYPGYYVDSFFRSPALEPYTHYLILKNPKGKRIAIVPSHGVKDGNQKNASSAIDEYQQLRSTPQLFSFPLDRKGRVRSPEGEGMVYLIYLAMRKHDYALAKQWISQVKRERPEWEKKWCVWIEDLAQSLDHHPEAVALRLQLYDLMHTLSSAPFKDHTKEGIRQDYFRYLELRKHAVTVFLDRHEEKKILKIVEDAPLNPSRAFKCDLRRAHLENKSLPTKKEWTSDIDTHELSQTPDFLWINAHIEERMWEHLDSPRPIALLARPGSALIDNFLHDYAIARHAPEQREALKEKLRLCRMMQDRQLSALHQLLMNVALEPDKFPTIGEIKTKKITLAEFLQKLQPLLQNVHVYQWSFQNKLSSREHTLLPEVKSFEPSRPVEITSVCPEKVTVADVDFTRLFVENELFVRQKEEVQKAAIEEDLTTLNEMESFFAECKDSNPCVKREFELHGEGVDLMQGDLNKALSELTPAYLINPTKREVLSGYLDSLVTQQVNQMTLKKEQVLALAHAYTDKLALEKEGRMLHPLSFRELIVYFGTGNDKAIYLSNPSLDGEKLKTLKTLLTDYLILSTDRDHILRMKRCLNNENALIGHAGSKRVYDPIQEPHLLVFEYFGKIRLHLEQYQALLLMTGTEDDIEYEARTGFGKSTMLIPLWLFLKCQKEKTAMMTVPSSLLRAQHMHLKKLLGRAYDMAIVPIVFNRADANDPKYLKRLSQKLDDARLHKKVILTTVQSLHGMINLKLKESLSKGEGEIEVEIQTHLLALRKKIATQVADFFDESRECFSIRQRYDYAVGALSAVDPVYLSDACALYREFFINNSDIPQTFQFEFLPQDHTEKKQPKQIPLRENYEKELLPLFAKKAIQLFSVSQKWEKVMLNDLQGVYSKECEDFYKTLSPVKLEEYDRVKKQLTIHLPRTLFRKCDDGYGFYSTTRLAIPFLDGTAKKTSEFSEVEDIIDFTIQANLKNPFSVEDVEMCFTKLKVKLLEVGLEEIQFTDAYQLLQTLTAVPLMELDRPDYEKMTQLINTDRSKKLAFICSCVLPQIKVYKKKIASTSFNLIRAIHHLQAASGTVSPEMLPPRLKTKEDRRAVMRNLMALWKHSQNRIFLLSAGGAQEKLKNLLAARAQESVLIDVAGTFRELDLVTTAKTILEAKHCVQGVVLYDEEGREYVYERATQILLPREESLLQVEDLFIFIRKSKAIGTDTEMLPNAEGIVTIDRDSYRDLVFQGVGRMRGLAEGQTAGFALAEEDASIMFASKEMTFRHLVDYVIRVQGKQKGEDVFYALRLYLEDLIDEAFWQGINQRSIPKEIQSLFKTLERFVVKETQAKPLATLRQSRAKLPASEAIAQLKKEMLEPVKQFCKEEPKWAHLFDVKKIEEKFDAFVDLNKLPREIYMHGSEESISIVEGDVLADSDEVYEEVADKMTDLTVENENISDHRTEIPSIRYKPDQPLSWDGNYHTLFQKKPATTLLKIGVYYGPNFRRVSKDTGANSRVQKPADQILVHKSPEGYRILLLDLHDAAAVMRRLLTLKTASSNQDSYYLLSGQSVIAFDGKLTPQKGLKTSDSLLSIRLIHKLFTASEQLAKEEKQHLLQLHKTSKEFTRTFREEMTSLQKVWPQLTTYASQCRKIFDS